MAGHTMLWKGCNPRPAEDSRPQSAERDLIALVFILMLVLTPTLGFLPVPPARESPQTSACFAMANPVANAGPDQVQWYGNLTALDASGTTSDYRPSQLNYNWTIEDNGTHYIVSHGVRVVQYKFSTTGIYTVNLTVTDPLNRTSSNQTVVTVIPKAELGSNRRLFEGKDSLNISFDGSNSEPKSLIFSYQWTITKGDKLLKNATGPLLQYTFPKAGNYTVTLTVRDSHGLSGTRSVNVNIVGKPSFFVAHWFFTFVGLPIILVVAYIIIARWRKGSGIITKTDVEKARLQWKILKKDWKIFRSNRLGFAGLIVLVIFLLVAILAPVLATVPHPDKHQEPNVPNPIDPRNLPPLQQNPLHPSLKKSIYTNWMHPLGTDHKGQDIYSLTLYGARASLIVGVVATAISVILGTLIGLGAGYFGRVTDEVLMRVTDFFLVLPWFPLMIVLMAILGQKFLWVVVVIGITSWPSTARVVRSQVLTVKERQFIVRAQAVGASDGHIIRTHILPNVLPLIFANTVLLIAIAIFSESFLDFFGLGDPSVISWGSMLESAYLQQAFKAGAWWWIGAPGVAIVSMVLAFSLVGYAVDDVLNPKLRRR